MRAHLTSTHLTAGLALAAAAAVAAPAAAQIYDTPVYAAPAYSAPAYSAPAYDVAGPVYVEELVIPGPLPRDGRPARLSRVVSIRDLNLVMPQDREILRLRIRDTARELCRALGEDFSGSSIVPSCQDQAVRDTRPQVKLAINQAFARATYASLEARDPYAWQPY